MTDPYESDLAYERDLRDAGRGHLISGWDADFILDEMRDSGELDARARQEAAYESEATDE